eukprot:1469167-Pleurochrysis_carterae.AAC.2
MHARLECTRSTQRAQLIQTLGSAPGAHAHAADACTRCCRRPRSARQPAPATARTLPRQMKARAEKEERDHGNNGTMEYLEFGIWLEAS